MMKTATTVSTVNAQFILGGGAWKDYALSNELRNGRYVKSALQYENVWCYPILFGGPKETSQEYGKSVFTT